MPDPSNLQVWAPFGAVHSLLEVRGVEPRPWDEQTVGRGTIHIESYQSKKSGRTRRVYIYTPPDYGSRDPAHRRCIFCTAEASRNRRGSMQAAPM